MRSTAILILVFVLAVVVGAGSFAYSRLYRWLPVETAVVEANSKPYTNARVYRSPDGAIAVDIDEGFYVYYPEIRKIGLPAGSGFYVVGALLFTDEPRPQIFFADGVKVDEANLVIRENYVEFSVGDSSFGKSKRISVRF